MAHDSLGTQDQPHYAGTGAPADAADLTEVSDYAALVGNTKTGTAAQMNALAGADRWIGLLFSNTETADLGLYKWTGTAWAPQGVKLTATSGKTSAFPANTLPLFKIERVSATSASNGTLAATFPTAFPSGVSAIFFTMATGSSNNPVLNSDTLSTTGFTVANLPASTAVVFYYQAIGW